MAKTQIADILVPTIFDPYVIERSTVLTDFGDSDIILRSPELDGAISKGAKLVNLPAWKASTLSGQSRQIISDTNAFSTNKVDTATDVARISNDGNAWSANMLAQLISGDDPMMAIGEMVAQYWAEVDQSIIINSVKGLLGAASFSTNLLAIHQESIAAQTAASKLTGTTFIDALQKLGDAAAKLTAIAVHSATQAALKKLDLIDYLPDSEGKANIEVFQGRRVITVDSMPTRAGSTDGTVYTSVLFGPGAFGFGNQVLGDPAEGGFGTEGVEYSRVALNHDAVLINRRRWLKHPRGMAWQEVSIAESGGPDDTELAESQQWVKVWQTKNVRIVGITHNN